jgi:hypothetical protein
MIHAASHVYKEEQTLPNSLSRKEDHTVLLRLICVSTEPAHRPLKAFHCPAPSMSGWTLVPSTTTSALSSAGYVSPELALASAVFRRHGSQSHRHNRKVAAEIVEVVVAEKHSFYVSHRGKGAKDAGVYS